MPPKASQRHLVKDTKPPVALGSSRYAMPIAKLLDPHPPIISTLKWMGHVCQLTESESIGTVILTSSSIPPEERALIHDQCLMFNPEYDVVALQGWNQ